MDMVHTFYYDEINDDNLTMLAKFEICLINSIEMHF